MKHYKYSLTELGKERIEKDYFYGQKWESYKGYTEAVFQLLYEKGELSLREIVKNLDIKPEDKGSIPPILYYNHKRGYIKRRK